MIVAGLELTRMILYPSSLRALQSLGSGVIEFAGLADDDRAGADDEYGFYVCAFWHGAGLLLHCAVFGHRPLSFRWHLPL